MAGTFKCVAMSTALFLAACAPLPCAGVIGERTMVETRQHIDGTWVQSVRTVRACMVE